MRERYLVKNLDDSWTSLSRRSGVEALLRSPGLKWLLGTLGGSIAGGVELLGLVVRKQHTRCLTSSNLLCVSHSLGTLSSSNFSNIFRITLGGEGHQPIDVIRHPSKLNHYLLLIPEGKDPRYSRKAQITYQQFASGLQAP